MSQTARAQGQPLVTRIFFDIRFFAPAACLSQWKAHPAAMATMAATRVKMHTQE